MQNQDKVFTARSSNFERVQELSDIGRTTMFVAVHVLDMAIDGQLAMDGRVVYVDLDGNIFVISFTRGGAN